MITTFVIDAPVEPAKAFEYIADITKHSEWSPGPYWIDPPLVMPITEGSSFVSHGRIPGDKDHTNQVVVTELNPPRVLVLTSEDRGQQFVHRFDVTPTRDGCRVSRTVDSPKPTGLLRLVFPLIFAVVIKPDAMKGMDNLRQRLTTL
jgi:uncharacterized protein YndB with AHSA1/START domain